MVVSLHALPQLPASAHVVEGLQILGFVALSDAGCHPLKARYRMRPAQLGPGGGELPPLFPCLLNHLLGGLLLAEAGSHGGRADRGAAPAEPAEPSAAVVRTADGRIG